MTPPSETRAGKLRDIAFAIMNTAESSDECADKVLVDRSLVGQLREALAASEPVERQWHLPWKHPANVAARASEAVVTPPNVAYVIGYVQGAYDFCQSAEPPAQEEVIAAANEAVKQDLPSTAPAQPGKGEATLKDAPPIPAWLIDVCQSRVWAAAWEMSAKAHATPQPSDPAEGAKRWPFVESPGEFTARLE